MSVTVYSTPTCGFCHQLKAYLQQRGVPFVEHDVSRDPAAARQMIQLSGQQGVPVTVIDGQVVVGFNRPQIDQLLGHQAGRPPRLGAAIADAGRIAARRGLELPQGAFVGQVESGSTAGLAGIQVGDVIVHLAGKPIHTDRDVDQVMAGLYRGQLTSLSVWRDGRTMNLTLRL